HDADVAGRAVVAAGDLADQLGVVGRVVAVLAGVARRVDARPTVERVDLQARVLTERPQARGTGGVHGLGARVLLEGAAGLLELADLGVVVEADELDRLAAEQTGQLAKLAGVARREQ